MEQLSLDRQLSSGSAATQTSTSTADGEQILVLKLTAKKPSVKWTEDTINNENLGRRSSKRCCIFHKQRAFGESDSDESDSDTEIAKKEFPRAGVPPNYQRHHA